MATPMTEHQKNKLAKVAGVLAPLVAGDVVLPNLMRQESLDQYRGSENDTLTYWIKGVLPAREYAWRNDRSSGLIFDDYSETKVTLTAGNNAYSAVRLKDEQYDMDFGGWEDLLAAQAHAVAMKLEQGAADYIQAAPYEVKLGLKSTDLKGSLIRSKGVQDRLTGTGSRVMVVGTDIEGALLGDDKLSLASNVGDAEAVSALREATLGKRYGYTFVVSQSIDPKKAYAFGGEAFLAATLTPAVPQSVPFGTTVSDSGISMRWIRDYDPEYLRDRSIVNTYFGYRAVKDIFKFWDKAKDPDQETVQNALHFVRAIELTLDGTDTLPAATSDIAKATGVKAAA